MPNEPPPLVSADDWDKTPPAVQQAFLTLVDLVRSLDAQVKELRAQVKQTSRNSSKPPSSDPPSVPPPLPRTPRGRSVGAQKGHEDQQRPLLPPEQVQETVICTPDACAGCGAVLPPTLPDVAARLCTQICELPPLLAHVTEYQCRTLACPTCQHITCGSLPTDIPPGAFGPRLTALVAVLHGRYRLSTRETSAFVAEVCGIEISLGSIASSCTRVSDALAPVDAAIHATVQAQPQLYVDETSWREQHKRCWLWVAVSPVATCFRIDPRRSQPALQDLIGDLYRGVVHSDRASAYHLLPNAQRQVCWAHLVRNFQGLVDQQHAESYWAQRMLAQTTGVFAAWHAYRSGFFDQIALQQALMPIRLALHDLLEGGRASAWSRLHGLSHDLLTHWDALWTFSRVEGIEPTNNTAERAVRPAVLWRKTCFGTQSASGSRFVERMLSVRATCVQQGRNLFAFLTDTVCAAWAGQPAPTIFATP